MLYREIIAVCSEIHTKHKNTVCGQNVELLNVKLAVHIVTTGLEGHNIYCSVWAEDGKVCPDAVFACCCRQRRMMVSSVWAGIDPVRGLGLSESHASIWLPVNRSNPIIIIISIIIIIIITTSEVAVNRVSGRCYTSDVSSRVYLLGPQQSVILIQNQGCSVSWVLLRSAPMYLVHIRRPKQNWRQAAPNSAQSGR
jgi:hypothetical protein